MRKRKFFQGKGASKRTKDYYPYKNEFEYNLSQLLTSWVYEDKSRKVQYIIPKVYNPDFTNKAFPWLLIEAKGIFLGGQPEARKYVELVRCNPNLTVFFIFEDPWKTPYTGCKRRRDGSRLTCAEWAASHSFPFCSAKEIPHWINDNSLPEETMRIKVAELLILQKQMFVRNK